MDIPEINNRIRQLVDYYAKGKVLKFSEIIGVKQQTVNRLFNIDTRTGKYPIVTTDVLVSITEKLVNVDAVWVLTGRGSMLCGERLTDPIKPTVIYKSDPKDAAVIAAKDEVITAKQMIIERDAEVIANLRNQIKELESQLHNRSVGLGSAPAADTPSIGGCQVSAK